MPGSMLDRTLSDRAQFLRTAWANPAFTDVTLAIRFRGQESPTQDAGASRYVECIKFQLAKHSPIFRAQIERWDGTAAATAAGRMLEATVDGEEDLAALMQLLEAMHAEALPAVQHPQPGLHLCRLLRLAHFYSVHLVLKAAAEQLEAAAPSLPAAECASALCALAPLVEVGEGGHDVLGRALAACEKQLLRLLDPLDRIFEEEELGATFDALPLPAVARAVQAKPLGAAPSQETAFLASLRWLDANEGAEEGAAGQLLSRLDFGLVSSSLMLAAARGHAGFRAWPGALPALAAAAFLRDASAQAGSAGAAQCRQRLKALGESLAVGGSLVVPPPLVLELEVPLAWLEEQAAALEQRTVRLQAQPASQQEVASVQQQLVAVFRGAQRDAQRAYRGYSWASSLALFLRINRPKPTFTAGLAAPAPRPAAAAAGGAAPAAPWPPVPPAAQAAPAASGVFGLMFDAQPQQRVGLADLHLSASLQLEVKPLAPLAPAPAGTASGSSAHTPGPLARVTFATGTSSGGVSAEPLSGGSTLVLGAYGDPEAAAATAAASLGSGFSFGAPPMPRWQPPCPPGGAECLVGVFENRPSGTGFGATPVTPTHKLPDLSKHARGGKLRFQVTVELGG